MSKEAMKLALEALKRMKRYGNTFGYRSNEQNPYEQVCEAIEALEALAQQPAQQEQVAWKMVPREPTHEMLKAMDECSTEGYDERLYAGHASSVYMAAVDAAPTPPAQRTWVGLTPEQAVDLYKATETDNRMVLIDAIEAKLKEKNNGYDDRHGP